MCVNRSIEGNGVSIGRRCRVTCQIVAGYGNDYVVDSTFMKKICRNRYFEGLLTVGVFRNHNVFKININTDLSTVQFNGNLAIDDITCHNTMQNSVGAVRFHNVDFIVTRDGADVDLVFRDLIDGDGIGFGDSQRITVLIHPRYFVGNGLVCK